MNPNQFWNNKIVTHTGCWEWEGRVHKSGYKMIRVKGVRWYIHRLAYTLINGPIPEGLQVCHSCDNRKCFNPKHLWTGTNQDNVEDRTRKGRSPIGELHRNTKLTDAQVLQIRKDPRTQEAISLEYGVSQGTISRIKRGSRRQKVQEPEHSPVDSMI